MDGKQAVYERLEWSMNGLERYMSGLEQSMNGLEWSMNGLEMNSHQTVLTVPIPFNKTACDRLQKPTKLSSLFHSTVAFLSCCLSPQSILFSVHEVLSADRGRHCGEDGVQESQRWRRQGTNGPFNYLLAVLYFISLCVYYDLYECDPKCTKYYDANS